MPVQSFNFTQKERKGREGERERKKKIKDLSHLRNHQRSKIIGQIQITQHQVTDLVLILQPLHALVQLLDLDNQIGYSVKEPVKYESSTDQESVALTLHDRLLMAEELGGGARLALTSRPSFILPINIQKQEQAEGDYREERLEEVPSYGDQALAKTIKTGKGEEEDHDGFCTCSITKNNPLQGHL